MLNKTRASTAFALAFILLAAPVGAQSEKPYGGPRTPDGNPDLNGIWQALGSAHWDIEGHAARPGPYEPLGRPRGNPGGSGRGDSVPALDGGEARGEPGKLAEARLGSQVHTPLREKGVSFRRT